MKILLSSNKEIIKQYLKSNSNIGFIPTASELDNDRWYMEKDRKDLLQVLVVQLQQIQIYKNVKQELF